MNKCCLDLLNVRCWRIYANYADPAKSADTYDYDSYRIALDFRDKILHIGGYVSVSEPQIILERKNTSFFNADKRGHDESHT
jgi:hypothetical protein